MFTSTSCATYKRVHLGLLSCSQESVASRRGNAWLCVAVRLTFCTLAAFVFAARADAAPKTPVLISEPTSTRAIALDAVAFTREPFATTSPLLWVFDHRTRVMLFALNLTLPPGGDFSGVTADAEDGAHRRYNLKVEYAAPVPGQEWMSAVVVTLDEGMGDAGDVLVRVVNLGAASNRVRIGVGHVGGGLADDAGSQPTPAPPYLIRGRVTAAGVGLDGVTVALGGDGSALATTDDNGNYSLFAQTSGEFVLSASKAFYDFSPSSLAFTNLSNRQDGVDFSAVRQRHNIFGQVRATDGMEILNVELILTGSDGSTQRALTDDSGFFSFFDLPAGLSYTIMPTSDTVFTFTPQTISQLTDTVLLNFEGVRRLYTISGRVTSSDGGALGGVAVDLEGMGRTAVSDASGNYSFTRVGAGLEYRLVPAKDDYLFTPHELTLEYLSSDQRVDFAGMLHIAVSGRVADGGGRGIGGIMMSLSGTQTFITPTLPDGTYSFIVTAYGNYTVRPSQAQDYYAYTPNSINLTGLKDSRVADFTAALNASVTPSYVLEFDGAPKSVDYSMAVDNSNLFWPEHVEYGHFFWEFWAMPSDNAGATYMISDGYGGAHAILFGVANFSTSEANRYQLLGNIWNGSTLTYFGSDQGPAPHEWGHFAAGWDGKYIVTYFDGVPVGKTPFVGPRITPGPFQGCGRLLIGGSDHSNFVGRIAEVRGYESDNPREDGNSVYASFTPQTVFAVDGQMLSYYFRPSDAIADLSLTGYFGKHHPGLVRSTLNGVLASCDGCPLPQFVVDPTAPDFAHPDHPGQINAPVETPGAVPNGALVFDSFSRRNSTYLLGGAGGLGSTESGSAGTRAWRTNENPARPQPFGILDGRGVLLADATTLAWVSPAQGTGDLDVRVDRHPGIWGSGHDTGISFRVADAADYFFAYSTESADASQPQTLTVGYYQAGQRTNLATGMTMPSGWTTLRVVTTAAGVVRVYADNTLLYSATSSFLSDADGAGLYNNGAGLGLTNRWDNFTIFKAQP